MHKSTDMMNLTNFVKSHLSDSLREFKVITIIELCNLINQTIEESIKCYESIPYEIDLKELLSMDSYKWMANKIIRKHHRFNATGKRGYITNYFHNLRDLFEGVEEWALIMVGCELDKIPENLINILSSYPTNNKTVIVIAQDIEPQPKENETH